jgi:protein-S-isoprenylcysteine O-methyltransferase Ste14
VNARIPKVLFAVAVGVLIVGLVRQSLSLQHPLYLLAFACTLGYLVWMFAEARITFGRSGGSAPDPSVAPYGLARLGTITAAVLGPFPWAGWTWWLMLPPVLLAGGITLRLWAIQVLGRFYSHRVVRHEAHRIVTTGPYSRVRHPAYTGMIVANIGFVALFLNVFSAAALVLLCAALAWRIRVEERILWTVPGYTQYCVGKPRLIPTVW